MMCVAGLLAAAAVASGASKREVAITLDDLPVAQSGTRGCEFGSLQMQTLRLITLFLHQKAPLAGFVAPGTCPELAPEEMRAVLKLWVQAGTELGNETFSGADLNTTDPAKYEQEILQADEALRALPGGAPRYFRYPLLHTGATAQTRERIARFLSAHGYTIAPVTLDNLDWMFSEVYSDALSHGKMEAMAHVRDDYLPYMESVIDFCEQRTMEVLGREIPQILLLHANRLNADMGADVLAALKKRGYHFIALGEALQDPAYQQPEKYVGPEGLSWIQRWSLTKGMPDKAEPKAPTWLEHEYERIRKGE
jgi:peptidoglycan/xylan/chitin deacetylase (PgdA/CDA1 family)